MDKVFAVIVDNDQLKCYDTTSGSLQGTYTFNGKVLNGPIVTGDRVTIVFETAAGKTGRIFKLPSFSAVSSFSVN